MKQAIVSLLYLKISLVRCVGKVLKKKSNESLSRSRKNRVPGSTKPLLESSEAIDKTLRGRPSKKVSGHRRFSDEQRRRHRHEDDEARNEILSQKIVLVFDVELTKLVDEDVGGRDDRDAERDAAGLFHHAAERLRVRPDERVAPLDDDLHHGEADQDGKIDRGHHETFQRR